MAGIQSLMQAPGQAQQAPLPGMMPSQQGSRPGVPALVPSLSGMDIGKLLQMFNDPNSPVPKNRVLAAMDQQQKQMAAQKAVQGQVAMAQAQQQPGTVKDQVVQGALQELRGAQPTQMAAHGGMMHGYAGGGAVAFGGGGNPTVEQILQKAPSARTPEENEILRAAGVELTRRTLPEGGVSALNKMLEGPFFRRLFTGDTYKLSPEDLAKRTDTGATTERMFRALGGSQFVEPTTAPAAALPSDTGDELTRMLARAPAPVPMSARDTRGATPESVAAARQLGTSGQRQVAAPRPGLSGLVGPEIDPSLLEGRQAASEYQAALQKASQLSPEQIAARQKIDEAMSGRKRFIGTEEQRRESLAEKRLQEALERSRVKPLEDITFIGQMLEGMKGSKRFGEGLAGLAAGAGRAQAGREAAVRAAEEKYDISRNDIFKLQDARNQLDMDEAKLAEARATGDTDKINAAAANVAKSKMDFAKLQSDINDRALGRRLEREKIDVEREKIRATLEGTQAGREASKEQRLMTLMANAEARKQELIRKTVDDFKDANKQVYLMTRLPGAKVTPDMMAQRQDLDRQLAAKVRAATADLDKIIAQTASQIPGFGSLYGTSGGGVPAGVTVEKLP